MIVLDLVYKLALLVTFSILSGFISGKYSATSYLHKILQGLLFGFASCIGMFHPFIEAEGIFFDGRSVVISLCTLFFGLEAGLINSIMAVSFRVYLGGSGTIMGIMVITTSFLIGLYFHYRRKRRFPVSKFSLQFLYFFGVTVHVFMLVMIITLPGKYILQTYKSIAITVIGIYPVITLLIGKILSAFQENREFIEDIKELNRKLEEKVENRTAKLKEVNKELDAYTYTISHDLRAPLRAIKGFAGFLIEDNGDRLGGEAVELVKMIQANAVRMGQLIDDLLNFSRFGNVQIQAKMVTMEKIVRETYQELESNAKGTINFTCGSIEDAVCDESLIRQVWMNLLSNAIKYTSGGEQAAILVESRKEEGWLIYSIKDNGVGFDMKYSDKLFRVFQRLHSPGDFEGTGVGLAIVKRIIERMGGKVWAEGYVNKGATFSFSLPQ